MLRIVPAPDEHTSKRWIANAVGVGDRSYRAWHCARGALRGKLKRVGHRFWLNMMSGERMFNRDLRKRHWRPNCTHPYDSDLVSGYLLTLSAQKRENFHAQPASQANQEHLHRVEAQILPTILLCCIQCNRMTRTTLGIKAHIRHQLRPCCHYLCH